MVLKINRFIRFGRATSMNCAVIRRCIFVPACFRSTLSLSFFFFFFFFFFYYFICYVPLNVLHQFETAAASLNFVDGSRRDFVDQPTKNDSVAEYIFVSSGWQFLSDNSLDPVKYFLFLFLVATLQWPIWKWRRTFIPDMIFSIQMWFNVTLQRIQNLNVEFNILHIWSQCWKNIVFKSTKTRFDFSKSTWIIELII